MSPPERSAAPSEATLAPSLQRSSGREVRAHLKGAGVRSASAQCRGAGRPRAARHRTIAEPPAAPVVSSAARRPDFNSLAEIRQPATETISGTSRSRDSMVRSW